MFPARSAAVSTAECAPATAVETSLLIEADGGPESESVTAALTVAIDWPSSKVGAAPHEMVGGVASRFTVTDPDPGPPAEVAVQVEGRSAGVRRTGSTGRNPRVR